MESDRGTGFNRQEWIEMNLSGVISLFVIGILSRSVAISDLFGFKQNIKYRDSFGILRFLRIDLDTLPSRQ